MLNMKDDFRDGKMIRDDAERAKEDKYDDMESSRKEDAELLGNIIDSTENDLYTSARNRAQRQRSQLLLWNDI
jgi:hypothetical protein